MDLLRPLSSSKGTAELNSSSLGFLGFFPKLGFVRLDWNKFLKKIKTTKKIKNPPMKNLEIWECKSWDFPTGAVAASRIPRIQEFNNCFIEP